MEDIGGDIMGTLAENREKIESAHSKAGLPLALPPTAYPAAAPLLLEAVPPLARLHTCTRRERSCLAIPPHPTARPTTPHLSPHSPCSLHPSTPSHRACRDTRPNLRAHRRHPPRPRSSRLTQSWTRPTRSLSAWAAPWPTGEEIANAHGPPHGQLATKTPRHKEQGPGARIEWWPTQLHKRRAEESNFLLASSI